MMSPPACGQLKFKKGFKKFRYIWNDDPSPPQLPPVYRFTVSQSIHHGIILAITMQRRGQKDVWPCGQNPERYPIWWDTQYVYSVFHHTAKNKITNPRPFLALLLHTREPGWMHIVFVQRMCWRRRWWQQKPSWKLDGWWRGVWSHLMLYPSPDAPCFTYADQGLVGFSPKFPHCWE